jgi:hypothetical protein
VLVKDQRKVFPLFSTGGPNSALVFCFAEFAFLAIELGIDAERWARLLPLLIAVQEVYSLAFNEMKDDRIVPRAGVDFSKKPLRAVHYSIIREIRDRYLRMSSAAHAAAAHRNIVAAVLPDDEKSLVPSRSD